MAVFNVPSTSLSRPLQLPKLGFQVHCSCETILHIQEFRAQRHPASVVVLAKAGQHGIDSKSSQIRVRGLGKASRALAEPSVAASLAADEPEESSAANNGSVGSEDTDLEEEDVNEVELSEEGGENGAISSAALQREVARRRNFAIISHPDAGKTTLVNFQFKFH